MSWTTNDDGGQAFPSGNPTHGGTLGMSLRDYFAAQALMALVPTAASADARRGDLGVQAKAADYAQVAYALADAMLKARVSA